MRKHVVQWCIAAVVTAAQWAGVGSAEVSLPRIFGDRMVLQQGMRVPVWGWADPGEQVTVTFGTQQKTTAADARGRWMTHLAPMAADENPRTMTVSAGNTLTFSDVLVGEVWVCSGQSNMAMMVRNSDNAAEEIAAANYPTLRVVTVPQAHALLPRENINASWITCSPQTAGNFTAVGYFFARELLRELRVPVGLINTSWGGTRIEPWTSLDGFASVPELETTARTVESWNPQNESGRKAHEQYLAKIKEWLPAAEAAVAAGREMPPQPATPWRGDHQQPTRLYNAMVHPLVPYAMRGVLWYQGEANGNEGITYFQKMQALVNGWRKAWGQGDFPFLFVQLANYRTSDPNKPAGGDGYANVRHAQFMSLAIPNTGMACIIDIGEAHDIHPRNKQDVGKRLSLWALNNTYGKPCVVSGPLYKSHAIEGDAIRVTFDHVGGRLMAGEKKGLAPTVPSDEKLKWFAIAGADKVWYWAEATIDGSTVLVRSPNVAAPVAVRYAFAANPAGCNLYNREGLPASPFRTDSW